MRRVRSSEPLSSQGCVRREQPGALGASVIRSGECCFAGWLGGGQRSSRPRGGPSERYFFTRPPLPPGRKEEVPPEGTPQGGAAGGTNSSLVGSNLAGG